MICMKGDDVMIVTSKRCFINCVAQFMDHRQLLDTNYYICDVSKQGSQRVTFSKDVTYDENGFPIIHEKPVSTGPSYSRFHLVYSDGSLDPSTNILTRAQAPTSRMNVTAMTDQDALKIYQDYLMEPYTVGNVYSWFYGSMNKPDGNGMMILIINDENNVRVFGHTICQFLAQFMGEDIEFVDAQVRPQLIPGYPKYQGNKQFAERVLRDQRDYALLMEFLQYASTMGRRESRNNMMTFLNTLNPNGLIHLYELAFPNEPLPPGNYTTDNMKQILIGKALDRIPENKIMPNLYESDSYLDSLDDEIDRLAMETIGDCD